LTFKETFLEYMGALWILCYELLVFSAQTAETTR